MDASTKNATKKDIEETQIDTYEAFLMSSFSCIDCCDDVRKKIFWGCEECGLNTCVDCCNNDNGFVLCKCCSEDSEDDEED